MIFVTVGAQMPFDRLISGVDRWAQGSGRRDIFAQIGADGTRPRFMGWTCFLNPSEFRSNVEKASVIIAHAGMGSIITALELGKPIVVMPRRGDLKETRNDHQLATARRLAEQGRVTVAWDDQELLQILHRLDLIATPERIGSQASSELIQGIRAFIAGGEASVESSVFLERSFDAR